MSDEQYKIDLLPAGIDYETHFDAINAVFKALRDVLPERGHSYAILALILDDAKNYLDNMKINL